MTKVNNLSSFMHSLVNETSGEVITARDMLNAVGRRSYGPVLLLLGFISISPLTIGVGAWVGPWQKVSWSWFPAQFSGPA